MAEFMDDVAAEAHLTAESRINDAPSDIDHLRLDILGLKSIPRSIKRLAKLRSLDLHNTRVSDLTPLADLSALQTLNLRDTRIQDCASLINLIALRSLNLRDTRISDLSPLAGLTALQSLDLRGTSVSNLAPLAALGELQSLDLGRTPVLNLAPIAALKSLQTLYLKDTKVSELAPLAGLSALQSLNLASTRASDLTPLAGLEALEHLNLTSSRVSNLTPLADLSALLSLNLTGTRVLDLSPLKDLGALQALGLKQTQISDLTPLAKLKSLSTYALNSLFDGVHWPSTIQDTLLRDLTSRGNPAATILGLNHLRRLQGLPLYWPEGYDGERELPPLETTEAPLTEAIAEIQLDDLPQQASAPAVFVANGTSPISLTPEQAGPQTSDQVELHEELIAAAFQLTTAIEGQSDRSNFLAGLARDVVGFTKALGADSQAMKPRSLWMRGNTLRRLYDADLRARASADPDDPPLPEQTAARLEVVVLGYNAFAARDPTLSELDQRSLGPVDRAQLGPSLDAGEALAKASLNAPDIMTPDAAALLKENAVLARLAATSSGPNADRLLTAALATMRNAGAAILRQLVLTARDAGKESAKLLDQFATSVASEAGKSVGKITGTALLIFVASQSGGLATLLFGVQGAPTAQHLLDLVIQIASKG